MTGWHLAHSNIAISRYPLDSAEMVGFTSRLDEINMLAERTPGFIWRAKGDAVDDEARTVFEEPALLFNLTVWRDEHALSAYVYRSAHVEVMRQKADWFDPATRASFVLWWLPDNQLPRIDDTRRRFERLWSHGPTAEAFTFANRFDPPTT
ncbi:MAG: DUF3291 domain-containing protein [Pseudomonadota bacterium]